MMKYEIIKGKGLIPDQIVGYEDDGTILYIPNDPESSHYKMYLLNIQKTKLIKDPTGFNIEDGN